MNKIFHLSLSLALLALAANAPANEAVVVSAADLKWVDGPASLPPGAKIAILEGDPSKAEPFTMRVKVPAGSQFLPHTHPVTERVTILSGTALFGLGEKIDEASAREMKAGDFAVIPPGTAHYAVTKSETVLQINATGPWVRQLIDATSPAARP